MALTFNERAVLFKACWWHPAAKCGTCRRIFRVVDLAGDIMMKKTESCPVCRADLALSIREHLASCRSTSALRPEVLVR